MFCLLVLMIGLRHEVGGDWTNYVRHIEEAAEQTLAEAMLGKADPAYALLNWIAARWGGGMYLVNFICGALFALGLITFCLGQPRPWLALAVAMPYLVTVVAMGYTRQGVAIGIAMLGLNALGKRQVWKFILWVFLAATFHKSAVILAPLALLAGSKRPLVTALLVGASATVMFVLLLQEMVDALTTNYLGAEMESSGAAIRVAMNALPAILFLKFRRRFNLSEADRSFWTWMSLIALGFVVLLSVSPSSTAVDRVALYWIPLQLFVWARVPDALGRSGRANAGWVRGVVGYSALVQLIWLVFATYSFAWLPYQFYPWVWMWE